MARLSEREYWDTVHAAEREDLAATIQPAAATTAATPSTLKKRLRACAEKLLGADFLAYVFNYEEQLLWHTIYRRYMPARRGAKVLEIGSAPGQHLINLSSTFGLDPYGVEYSSGGAQLNREVFAAAGIDPAQVFETDFFAAEFQTQYRDAFDVVVSRGFIEHFDDVEDVIRKHLNLLKPGGRLFVMIPNLRGLNYFLSWLFHKEVLAIHNLKIMDKSAFTQLFADKNLTPRFCDYYGVFSFYLFNTKPGAWQRTALRLCFYLQLPLNVAFRLLFGATGARSPLFSPALMFVGEKGLARNAEGAGPALNSGPHDN
ncbi:MAG: class I SAM-dependent methyltransferase [Chloroflexota bacterium]